VAGYSTVTGVDADRLRAAVFDTFWVKGLDIGDTSVLGELGCPTGPSSVAMQ
jgi:predicted DsbA family dithiol-disulfide isomerase